MKMELIEGSETSVIRTKTPGNYPKENIFIWLVKLLSTYATKLAQLYGVNQICSTNFFIFFYDFTEVDNS